MNKTNDLVINSCPVCQSSDCISFIKTKAQLYHSNDVFNFDQCKRCKFVFLNPRVPEYKLNQYYNSYYLPYRGASAWGKYRFFVERSLKKLDAKKIYRLKKHHDIKPSSLILDIGCGKPSFVKAIQEKFEAKALGIDFSDKGWKNNKEFSNLNLKVAEIKDLEHNLNPDVITMWHYLEHDYFPLKNLKHLKKISKPTTKLIIEIPNFDSYTRLKFSENWAGWHTPRHTSLFSPDNIKLLLNRSGWQVIKLDTFGTMDAYNLQWMSKMEEKNIDWSKNMEDEFMAYILGMIKFYPKKLNEKKSSLGIMTIVAEPSLCSRKPPNPNQSL